MEKGRAADVSTAVSAEEKITQKLYLHIMNRQGEKISPAALIYSLRREGELGRLLLTGLRAQDEEVLRWKRALDGKTLECTAQAEARAVAPEVARTYKQVSCFGRSPKKASYAGWSEPGTVPGKPLCFSSMSSNSWVF